MTWLAAVVAQIAEWFIQTLGASVLQWWKDQQAEKAAKAAAIVKAAPYQAIVNDPNATREEREAAESALLNL